MIKVVHAFVAECQKGFVPDTFIAEATMLTRLIDGYINEEGRGTGRDYAVPRHGEGV